MLFAFVGIAIGIGLIAAGIAMGQQLTVVSQFLMVAAGGLIILITGILTAITKLYRKTTAHEAFVRTGMGKARVVLDGGAFVVPIIHRVVPVSLETMRLDVSRRGEDALITGDNLRVDIAAEFFIKVQPVAEDILNAARSLGEKSVSEENIRELVMEKLISALRTVAATKSLIELHTKRDEFASAVQQIVTQDLQENGLTLESVTISSLDQTPLEYLKDDNIFDAQGKRRITEVTQETRKASTATHAIGTWKNTIRDDSPIKPLAGCTYKNAARMTTASHTRSTHLRISDTSFGTIHSISAFSRRNPVL